MSEEKSEEAADDAGGEKLFGLLAEFDGADALVAAARAMHGKGFRQIDGHTPFPVHGLTDALGFEERRLPWITFGIALASFLSVMFLQLYLNGFDYPLNVGGRPLAAWPAFVVTAFEVMVLITVAGSALVMLWQNGLPRLHHPHFATDLVEGVSRDRFLLSVGSDDRLFDVEETSRTLRDLGALLVERVPR